MQRSGPRVLDVAESEPTGPARLDETRRPPALEDI